MDIESDSRVTILPWIIFSLALFFWGLRAPIMLAIITIIYGVIVSTNLLIISWPRNWRWIFFSLGCFMSLWFGLRQGRYVRIQTDDAEDPEIVTWIQIQMCLWRSAAFLLAMLFIGFLLPKINCGLVGSSVTFAEKSGWGWNGRVAQHLVLGGCFSSPSGNEMVEKGMVPRYIAVCLVEKSRVFYSGEPALDYMYDLANTNTVLGCFLCHPVHGYAKMERIGVLLILAPLIVFPCALCRQLFTSPIAQMVVTAIFATIPRKILQAELLRIVEIPDKLELGLELSDEELAFADGGLKLGENRHSRSKKHVIENVLRNEIIFFLACFCVVITLGSFTCWFIKYWKEQPLGKNLLEACIGLDAAVVMEPAIRLILPCLSTKSIGFFGKWWVESQYYVPDVYVHPEPPKYMSHGDLDPLIQTVMQEVSKPIELVRKLARKGPKSRPKSRLSSWMNA